MVGSAEQHLNEIAIFTVWRISFSTLIVLSSNLEDLKWKSMKTPVWFYSYYPGENGRLLEYLDNSRMQGGRGERGSKHEKRVIHVCPLVLAELNSKIKAVYQPILLCKGCKMHLSCFTGCRSHYPLWKAEYFTRHIWTILDLLGVVEMGSWA